MLKQPDRGTPHFFGDIPASVSQAVMTHDLVLILRESTGFLAQNLDSAFKWKVPMMRSWAYLGFQSKHIQTRYQNSVRASLVTLSGDGTLALLPSALAGALSMCDSSAAVTMVNSECCCIMLDCFHPFFIIDCCCLLCNC